MDFKSYRLNKNSELYDIMAQMGDRFAPFNNSVSAAIDAIEIGRKFDIETEVHSSNLNLFIKCACFHIEVHNRRSHITNQWLEFTDDYRYIRRMS